MRGVARVATEQVTQSKETSLLQITSDSASITRLTTNVPRELRERPQWIYWRGEDRIDKRTGEVKLSKLPIDPKMLKTADKTDPRVWGTFEACCAGIARARAGWKEENPETYRGGGLGFVFTDQDPYVGVDLDGCRHPETGTLEPWARQIITVLRSYTEISPSGTGIHIYVKGRLSGTGQNKKPIEVYDRKAYFTVTGDRFPGASATIENRQTAVEWLYTAMPMMAKLLTDTDKREKFSRLFAGDISEYDGDESRADLAFCNMLVQAGACPDTECMAVIRLSGLYDTKWDREDYQERTIGKAREAKGSAPKAPWQTPTGGRVQVLSARELAHKVLPPVRCVVRGLVPEGQPFQHIPLLS
jgi:putative DNA primase/helicase